MLCRCLFMSPKWVWCWPQKPNVWAISGSWNRWKFRSLSFLKNFTLVSHNSCFTCSLGVCLCVFQLCAPKAIFLSLELMLQQSLSGLLIVVWCYAWCFGTQFELNVYCVIIWSLVRVKGDVISDVTVVISYLLFFLHSASVWCQWTSSSAVHLV